MLKPKVLILRTAGTNCDRETAFAFKKTDAEVHLVHINKLLKGEVSLNDYQILAIPGGFTYGDDIAAGKILANELRCKLAEDIKKFISGGKLIIGICNGFQVLVKAGILPGNPELKQEASLIINDSGKFEDRWVHLRSQKPVLRLSSGLVVSGIEPSEARSQKCIWADNLPEIIYLPVAHGEGKFITKDDAVLERLKKAGQVVFRYCDEKGSCAGYPYNPNGSEDNIAGICDGTGRILGLMPHPERHFESSQHPQWQRTKKNREGDGLAIIRNGVEYARNYL